MQIKELHLLSHDLVEAEKFYTGILGLEILEKQEDSISFKAGVTRLTFIKTEDQKPFYHFAFNIPNNKLPEALAYMSSKVEILETKMHTRVADFDNWNARSFYFFDTTGNILELIARFDLDNASDKAFDGSSVLSVSEIGVVEKDEARASDELIAEYGIREFARQPRKPCFIALGDDEGLIIVVCKQKKWYPTEITAKPFRTKLVFVNKDTTYEHLWHG